MLTELIGKEVAAQLTKRKGGRKRVIVCSDSMEFYNFTEQDHRVISDPAMSQHAEELCRGEVC